MAQKTQQHAQGVRDNERRNAPVRPEETVSDIPEFTSAQWNWLKDRTRHLEAGYVPTRSIVEGL
jgi:hypothetical protein